MNILLWILQILLALHTLMGAVWKFSNAEQSVPSLQAIPHIIWLALSVVEIPIAIALLMPLLNKLLAKWAPIAALALVIEMLFYTVVHLASGHAIDIQVIYWVVVAAISGFIAYGRFKLKPIK